MKYLDIVKFDGIGIFEGHKRRNVVPKHVTMISWTKGRRYGTRKCRIKKGKPKFSQPTTTIWYQPTTVIHLTCEHKIVFNLKSNWQAKKVYDILSERLIKGLKT